MKKALLVFAAFFVTWTVLAIGFDLSDVFGRTAIDLGHVGQDAGSKASAEHHSGGHHDPYASVYMVFFVVICCAVTGRWIAKKLGQSAVLGELIIGIVVGGVMYQTSGPMMTMIRHNGEVMKIINNTAEYDMRWDKAVHLELADMEMTDPVRTQIEDVLTLPDSAEFILLSNYVLLFSSFGVILLLFMVGLESSYEEMVSVGGPALVTASLGVIFPFLFGFLAMEALLPEGSDPNIAIFVGATLAATSIGITARVFKDLGKMRMPEAKVVLGAAVIDDILGLIVLAVVTGIISTGHVDPVEVGLIVAKAAGFLIAVIFFGKKLLDKHVKWFAKIDDSHVHLIYPFALMLALAFLADLIGLAPIIGAFVAGLIIKDEHFKDFKTPSGHQEHIESVIEPINGIFAPVFFVVMGFQVDVTAFADMNVLGIGLIVTVAAIAGKMLSSVFLKGKDKLIVGIGLVPRGEVGLIFAGIGKGLGVLNADMFAVVIIVVLLTTLVTPPLLKWAIDRKEKKAIATV